MMATNFKKTFKSEYHFGGKCTIQVMGSIIICSFGDNQLVWRDSLRDGGYLGRLQQFLEFNTSSYEAEKVMNHTRKKLGL